LIRSAKGADARRETAWELNGSLRGALAAEPVLRVFLESTLGEIAISVERAEAQARSFGHSRLDEIRILMLHGLLHLSGMDHENDRGEMARAEAHWRAQFGLPETLIARTVA
jgi:probable rRNA maturation factor